MKAGETRKAKTQMGWTILACAWVLHLTNFTGLLPNRVLDMVAPCELGLLVAALVVGILEDRLAGVRNLLPRLVWFGFSLVILAITFPVFAQSKR